MTTGVSSLKNIPADLKLAITQFRARRKTNKGKQIDNGSLYAGSPMYFYCRFCGTHTETCSEGYMHRPKTTCDPCKALTDKGIDLRSL